MPDGSPPAGNRQPLPCAGAQKRGAQRQPQSPVDRSEDRGDQGDDRGGGRLRLHGKRQAPVRHPVKTVQAAAGGGYHPNHVPALGIGGESMENRIKQWIKVV